MGPRCGGRRDLHVRDAALGVWVAFWTEMRGGEPWRRRSVYHVVTPFDVCQAVLMNGLFDRFLCYRFSHCQHGPTVHHAPCLARLRAVPGEMPLLPAVEAATVAAAAALPRPRPTTSPTPGPAPT